MIFDFAFEVSSWLYTGKDMTKNAQSLIPHGLAQELKRIKLWFFDEFSEG